MQETVPTQNENNPFAEFEPNAAPDLTDAPNGNPFAEFDKDEPLGQQTSTTGAFVRHAAAEAGPLAAGMAAAGAGAQLGVMAAPFLGPAAPFGPAVGGLAGFFLGAGTAGKAQEVALSKMPDDWKEAIGQDDRTRRLDESGHPIASFIGGLAPFALAMRPDLAWRAPAMREGATAMERVLAHPMTGRLFGGAMMGGMEAANEITEGNPLDWQKAGIATGFGMAFNRPTRFGEFIHSTGAAPVKAAEVELAGRRAFGEENIVPPSPAPPPTEAVPEPLFSPIRPRSYENVLYPTMTIAQAGDLKVMGPGITEEVFHGVNKMRPEMEDALRSTAVMEHDALGFTGPTPDIYAAAREMHPETFDRYDELVSRRDDLREWLKDYAEPPQAELDTLNKQKQDLQTELDALPYKGKKGRKLGVQIREIDSNIKEQEDRSTAYKEGRLEDSPEAQQVRKHLQDTEYELRDLHPEVQAGYRRAAERHAGEFVEPGTDHAAKAETDAIEAAAAEPEIAQHVREVFGNEAFARATQRNVPTTAIAGREGIAGAKGGIAGEGAAIQPSGRTIAQEEKGRPTNVAKQPAGGVKSVADQKRWIADDFKRKYMAAGRPDQEAADVGAEIAARYSTLSSQFGGALGTPEEVYLKYGPEIRGEGVSIAPEGMAEGIAGKTSAVYGPDFSGIKLATDEFAQSANAKIRIHPERKPLITIMKSANASSGIHELGHAFLEEMVRFSKHAVAPEQLKKDFQTILDWMGVKSADDIKTSHHEKFAAGWEQYHREGVAPSKELAGVFQRFKGWMLEIYQTLRGLGAPISEEMRGVFDRMLAEEPQRTVIHGERDPAVGALAAEHKIDASRTMPEHADAVGDKVEAETAQTIAEPPKDIKDEIDRAIAGPDGGAKLEAGAGGAVAGEVKAGGAEQRSVTEGGGVSAERERIGGRPGEAAEKGGPAPSGRPERGGATPGVGRAGEVSGNPLAPTGPDIFAKPESKLVDKAGNIRLDNLNTPEDIKQVLRDAAEANGEYWGDRRGVVTDGQVLDLAEALGMEPDRLLKRRIGQAFSAEEIKYAQKLLAQSSQSTHDLARRAIETGSPEDQIAAQQAWARHQLIQGQYSGLTAEAGRALRALRKTQEFWSPGAKTAEQFLREATGKTLFQLQEEMKLVAELDGPDKVSKFLNSRKRSYWGWLVEEFVNALISGPGTHNTYTVGTALLTAHKIVFETPASALVGTVARAMGREGGVRIGEVGPKIAGAVQGIRPGIKGTAQALSAGVNTLLPGETGKKLPFGPEFANYPKMDEAATMRDAISSSFGVLQGLKDGLVSGAALMRAGGVTGSPLVGLRYSNLGEIPDVTVRGVGVLPVGTLIRLPSRFVAAYHTFFRCVNYSIEKNAGAYRQAVNEGLVGEPLARRVAEIRQSPSEAQMEEWASEATATMMMGEAGKWTNALSRLRDIPILGAPVGKFVDPFVHIAGAVIDQSIIKRSPIGLFSTELRADLMGKNGAVAQDTAAGRMIVGTALGVTFGFLKAQNLATGSGPKDPKEAAMWRLAGYQAHSVRIGDVWYETHRLGALGMLSSISADLYEIAQHAPQKEATDTAYHLVNAFAQNILDESFMRGPAELIRALQEPERYGGQYIRNFLSSFLPYSVAMGQITRGIDPYVLQTRNATDAMRAKIPGHLTGHFGFGEMLPRRDIWGEPMANKEALFHSGVTSIWEATISKDPVNVAMLELGIAPGQPRRTITNVELTDQEYDDYSRIAGRTAKQRLDVIVNSPDFARMPAYLRHDTIVAQIRAARNVAADITKAKYTHIPQDAAKANVDRVNEEPEKIE